MLHAGLEGLGGIILMKLDGTMRVNERGHLDIGGCDTVQLAQEYGTPLYVLDEAHFRQNCRDFYQSFTKQHQAEVLYAGKTLLTLAICKIVAQEGLGLDVVSEGELYTAIKAGFPMERIYFHGNNKAAAELRLALDYQVGRIMVDNLDELVLLNTLAGARQTTANIMLRLTPGVDAHTHEYIRTGHIDSKFGLVVENGQAMSAVRQALILENINLHGFHCHIGSQIFELASYDHAAKVMLDFIHQVRDETGFIASELDLGGGLGIYYAAGDDPRSIQDYADTVIKAVNEQAMALDLPVPKILVEPGRAIAGPAGTTLYSVGTVKDIPGVRKYVAVDGGMCDNLRPALYQAKYEACLANRFLEETLQTVSIAGKCCESGDMLIWDLPLPPVQTGDILAVGATGAYNYTMSMNYNRLPRPAMVLVNAGQADVILQRESNDDLIRNDLVPDRLKVKS